MELPGLERNTTRLACGEGFETHQVPVSEEKSVEHTGMYNDLLTHFSRETKGLLANTADPDQGAELSF